MQVQEDIATETGQMLQAQRLPLTEKLGRFLTATMTDRKVLRELDVNPKLVLGDLGIQHSDDGEVQQSLNRNFHLRLLGCSLRFGDRNILRYFAAIPKEP